MAQPTLDDAIEALAAAEGVDPDSMSVGDFLVDSSPIGKLYETRVCSFRHRPETIAEAERFLRMFRAIEAMYAKIRSEG